MSVEIIEQQYPFTALKGGANVRIFPDLASANIAQLLAKRSAKERFIGPILVGMSHPAHVLQRTATAEEIVNVTPLPSMLQKTIPTCTCRSSPSWSAKIDRWTLKRLGTTRKADFSFQQQRNFAAVYKNRSSE